MAPVDVDDVVEVGPNNDDRAVVPDNGGELEIDFPSDDEVEADTTNDGGDDLSLINF